MLMKKQTTFVCILLWEDQQSCICSPSLLQQPLSTSLLPLQLVVTSEQETQLCSSSCWRWKCHCWAVGPACILLFTFTESLWEKIIACGCRLTFVQLQNVGFYGAALAMHSTLLDWWHIMSRDVVAVSPWADGPMALPPCFENPLHWQSFNNFNIFTRLHNPYDEPVCVCVGGALQ